MEITFLQIFIDTIIGVAIALSIVIFYSRKKERQIDIPNGERYSKLEIFKSIERDGKVIYYLGDEKNQIEVSKDDYDYAIKVYQESVKNEKKV